MGPVLALPAADQDAPELSDLPHTTISSDERDAIRDVFYDNRNSEERKSDKDDIQDMLDFLYGTDDSEERNSGESDEDDILQDILSFLCGVDNSDSKEDSDDSEDDFDLYGFIFGVFWKPKLKEPAVGAEPVTPEVLNAALVVQ